MKYYILIFFIFFFCVSAKSQQLTLGTLGPMRYTWSPVGTTQTDSGFIMHLNIEDASNIRHNAWCLDGVSVCSTMDLQFDQAIYSNSNGGLYLDRIFALISLAVTRLQIAEAGGLSQWLIAIISQHIKVEI